MTGFIQPTEASALTENDLKVFLVGLTKLYHAMAVIKPGLERLIRFFAEQLVKTEVSKTAIITLNAQALHADAMLKSGDALAKQQLIDATYMAAAGNALGVLTTINEGYCQLSSVCEQVNKLDRKLRDARLACNPGMPEELNTWYSIYDQWYAATNELWVPGGEGNQV